MSKLFHNFSEIVFGSEKNSPPNRQFITIGGQVFAVAHTPKEMARVMRINDQKVAGYVLQRRV